MAKKKLHQNIVIVCEGSETENHYFNEIKKISPKGLWVDIEIIPEPIKETIIRANNKRPKRNFIGGNKKEYRYITKEDTPENYELYKSQPTKYVREAQLFLDDGVYSDAWAVFDKDQHIDHANAFKLAKEAGVKIAFSSLAFETWILSHFEKLLLNFDRVQCKEKKKTISCGIKEVSCIDDNQCLCGYIRHKHFPEYEKDSENLYDSLHDKLDIAYENASWLRYKNNINPIYNSQKYTGVDVLVKALLGDDNTTEWINLNSPFPFEGGELSISLVKNHLIITNTGTSIVVLDKNVFLSDEYKIDPVSIPRHIINPKNAIEIDSVGKVCLNMITGTTRIVLELKATDLLSI